MGFLRPLQKLRNINVKNRYNQLALVELINAQEMEGVNQGEDSSSGDEH